MARHPLYPRPGKQCTIVFQVQVELPADAGEVERQVHDTGCQWHTVFIDHQSRDTKRRCQRLSHGHHDIEQRIAVRPSGKPQFLDNRVERTTFVPLRRGDGIAHPLE